MERRQRAAVARSILGIVLAAAGCAGDAPAGTPILTRGPYLQLLTTRSVTIAWNTSVVAPCVVSIGSADGGARTVAGGSDAVCAVPVEGLTPGASYTYTVLAGDTAIAEPATFRTDDPALPFTFLVLGDSGSGSPDQNAVRDRMLASPADFVLSTGDMVYEDGSPDDFDAAFFVPYGALLRQIVFWPTLGNHDVHTANGDPWRDAFYTPANNPARSEDYYSFDHGNGHVVVLNSNAVTTHGSPQYDFLDRDLGASTARWNFVAFHHPPYSTGKKHGSALKVRRNLVPLLDRYRVDVVFSGHNHIYERTKPLRDGTIVEPRAGTVYVTTGGGGKTLQGLGPPADFTAYAEVAYHFTRVTVDGDALRVEMVRADGTVGDELEMRKRGSEGEPGP